MYLWKCWRDTRWVIALSVVFVGALAWETIKGAVFSYAGPMPDPRLYAWVHMVSEGMFFAFAAWVVGSQGIGGEIGKGSGSYLLTRHYRRGCFVWWDWGVAMGQLAGGIGLLAIALWIEIRTRAIHTAFIAGMKHAPNVSEFSTGTDLLLSWFCMLLFVGLVFGISYLASVVMRRSQGFGLILAALIFFVYIMLAAQLKVHLHFDLPSWLYRPFVFSEFILAPNLALELIARMLLVLAFPLAAQLILNRAEV